MWTIRIWKGAGSLSALPAGRRRCGGKVYHQIALTPIASRLAEELPRPRPGVAAAAALRHRPPRVFRGRAGRGRRDPQPRRRGIREAAVLRQARHTGSLDHPPRHERTGNPCPETRAIQETSPPAPTAGSAVRARGSSCGSACRASSPCAWPATRPAARTCRAIRPPSARPRNGDR